MKATVSHMFDKKYSITLFAENDEDSATLESMCGRPASALAYTVVHDEWTGRAYPEPASNQ
ncbi:hypothetical protein [Bradyrhizobium cenepequi]|uniref:hypothetical protein n=1 Tax=Bradyrhizobium cenepequi TaxID=2821403 RepID=UPI001CE284BB|nr:hypothetical protein [Bradyrhizobium cenepequi]MCA6108129.1 hypothetical protein [Bradyrhizobium cenepequi]